jgi:hypothetical protein
VKDYFGRFLAMDISALRAKVGEPSLLALLHAQGVDADMLERLEHGTWKTLRYEQLFALVALAEGAGIKDFVTSADSAMWETFRGSSDKNRILGGSDKEGNLIGDDSLCTHIISKAGVKLKREQMYGSTDPKKIRKLLKTKNVLSIGGPKVNRGTEEMLVAFEEMGGPHIRFYWPGDGRKKEESGAGAPRMLEIDGIRHVQQDGHYVGVTAFCRHPWGLKGITIVLIAGCTKLATEEMIKYLTNPHFYRLFQSRSQDGKPVVLLFDSSKKPRWRVDGVTPAAPKKPGRKQGQVSKAIPM